MELLESWYAGALVFSERIKEFGSVENFINSTVEHQTQRESMLAHSKDILQGLDNITTGFEKHFPAESLKVRKSFEVATFLASTGKMKSTAVDLGKELQKVKEIAAERTK